MEMGIDILEMDALKRSDQSNSWPDSEYVRQNFHPANTAEQYAEE